jgi:hypothetical protein
MDMKVVDFFFLSSARFVTISDIVSPDFN